MSAPAWLNMHSDGKTAIEILSDVFQKFYDTQGHDPAGVLVERGFAERLVRENYANAKAFSEVTESEDKWVARHLERLAEGRLGLWGVPIGINPNAVSDQEFAFVASAWRVQ